MKRKKYKHTVHINGVKKRRYFFFKPESRQNLGILIQITIFIHHPEITSRTGKDNRPKDRGEIAKIHPFCVD